MGAHANGFRRPAAFVYDVPGGFAWVKPAYLDSYGASSHALHIIHGTIEPDPDAEAPGTRYRFENEDYSGTIEQDVGTNGDVSAALEWHRTELSRQGRSYAEERDRVWQMIARDLA